jgi:hypothetical protein
VINQIKLNRLFEKFPSLFSIVEQLNSLKLQWMIAGSGCLFLLGNDREPGDVDIYLTSSDHNIVDQAFGVKSFIYTSPNENVRNSNPSNNHDIQFTSNLVLMGGNQSFNLSVQQDILDHKLTAEYKSQSVFVLPPEEAILIKAILQRGPDQGKHDIEDIELFIKTNYQLDLNYLNRRIITLNAKERIKDKLNFVIPIS